jgi:hypothetical protein
MENSIDREFQRIMKKQKGLPSDHEIFFVFLSLISRNLRSIEFSTQNHR